MIPPQETSLRGHGRSCLFFFFPRTGAPRRTCRIKRHLGRRFPYHGINQKRDHHHYRWFYL